MAVPSAFGFTQQANGQYTPAKPLKVGNTVVGPSGTFAPNGVGGVPTEFGFARQPSGQYLPQSPAGAQGIANLTGQPGYTSSGQQVAPNGPPPPTNPGATYSATQTPGSQASANGGANYLDSTYYQNVAQNQFDVNNKINALNQSGAYGKIDLQNALSQLAYQLPLDNLHTTQAANNRGALFSTVLGQQLGQVARNYSDKVSGLNNQFSRQQAARDSQIKALLGGETLYDEQQAEAAAARAAQQAASDKSLGETVPGSGGGGGGGKRKGSQPAGGASATSSDGFTIRPGKGDATSKLISAESSGKTVHAPKGVSGNVTASTHLKAGVKSKPSKVSYSGKPSSTIHKLAQHIAKGA